MIHMISDDVVRQPNQYLSQGPAFAHNVSSFTSKITIPIRTEVLLYRRILLKHNHYQSLRYLRLMCQAGRSCALQWPDLHATKSYTMIHALAIPPPNLTVAL